MTLKRWYEQSYPADTPLVVLHPNFANQHLLLPTVISQRGRTAIVLTLQLPDINLRQFWSLLSEALQDIAGITLPNLGAKDTPATAAQHAIKAMKPIKQYVLFLDAYDLAGDAIHSWVSAFVQDIPQGSQVIIGARKAPLTLVQNHHLRNGMALYPVDEERMLLDYMRQPDQVLLEVYGHGHGRVLVNGRPIEQWEGMLPRSLFFYFIDKGMVTRDEIFQTFWPSLPTREATNVFHVTKRKISEILGFDLTIYSAGFYRIANGIDLNYDVVRFIENVQNSAVADEPEAAEMLQRAIDLYHGTFLSTISANWVNARREILQSIYVDALTSLARLKERRKREHEALGLYLRASAHQPHREDLARNIMSLYARLGSPAQALEVFKNLADDLKRDLNVTPDRRTLELAEKIRGSM